MLVRVGWPDCDARSFVPDTGSSVDAFWVESTPEEAAHLVEPRMSDEDRASIKSMEASYGWPHVYDGLSRCCFLVARDLSFIRAMHAHYPVHQMWNAYSPFRLVPQTRLQTLDDLSALPKPADA